MAVRETQSGSFNSPQPAVSSGQSPSSTIHGGRTTRFIIFMVALILILIMGYTWGFGLGGFQALASEASSQAGKSGLFSVLTESGSNIYKAIFTPDQLVTNYGFESDVQKNANNPDLGVKITDFKQLGKSFTKEPIELSGSVTAAGFDQPLNIEAFCSMNENSGKYASDTLVPAVLQGGATSQNKAKFYPGAKQRIQADCYFQDGLEADKVFSAKQSITTKVAKLYISYDFITKASMKMYMLSNEEYEKILQDPNLKDPFIYYKITESNLNSDNTIRSLSTDGPINLGIGTYISQPFSENREYPLGLTISPSSSLSTGELEKLESLEIMLPEYIYLQGDSEYGSSFNSPDCAFENTGSLDEDNFKVYKLKDELVTKLNNECSDASLKTSQLTKTDCYNLHWKNLNFRCKFKIVKSDPIQTMEFDYLRAVAKYKFKTEMPATVTVYKASETPLA